MTFEAQQCHADDPIPSPSPAVETTPSRDTSYDVVDVATARQSGRWLPASDCQVACLVLFNRLVGLTEILRDIGLAVFLPAMSGVFRGMAGTRRARG